MLPYETVVPGVVVGGTDQTVAIPFPARVLISKFVVKATDNSMPSGTIDLLNKDPENIPANSDELYKVLPTQNMNNGLTETFPLPPAVFFNQDVLPDNQRGYNRFIYVRFNGLVIGTFGIAIGGENYLT